MGNKNTGNINLVGSNRSDDFEPEEKISLQKCREILHKKELKYTDDEIVLIRDFMYKIAGITFAEYCDNKETAVIIPLSENTNDTNHEESHYLRAS